MKTIKYHIPVLTCLLLCGALNAQVAIDPVKNVYKIGGSSEIFISYSDGTNAKYGVLDVSTALDNITGVEEPHQIRHLDRRKTASATGDFNGDGAGNVVTVTANEEGKIRIIIPLIGEDLKISEIKEYDLAEQIHTRVRVISGNFDGDQQDEFAICYDLPDGTMTIALFKTDPGLNIEQIASFEGITRYDGNFDIAAGDMDGDGIDEIVMVNNRELPRYSSVGKVFYSRYDLQILKYDTVAVELTSYQERNFQLSNTLDGGCYPDQGMKINEMRIACGDLNNNGGVEIVVGWSIYYSYYEETYCSQYLFGVCIQTAKRYHWNNAIYLNAFELTAKGIENFQNLGGGHVIEGWQTRKLRPYQHIAMTLKCVQLDNLGRAKILYNSPFGIRIVAMGDDMKLNHIGHIPTGGALNIQGNETFAVADLNPDMTTLDFNKEVIILRSDKSAYEQKDTRYLGKTSIAIASFDKITPDGWIEYKTGPAFDLPFGSAENIEVSTFLTGDFDLSDAEVYFVGTPVIMRVSDLQQPIVILHSPPVHFDVIDGETFDLCNAYKEGATDFYARYNTTVNQRKTTSVMVNNALGVSSEIRAYSMFGGNGFELSAKANFERGRSFYNANIQNKTIEEEKTIYREDYVLYSIMDYDYYKYPVYDRKGEKLGDIAVLNPVSNFSSSWVSANSWTHPSYVFNSEPGNILSYKQRKNSLDFCTTPSDFDYHPYTRVPVSATGDGSFRFTFENISESESSYSYSGGVGASLFMKAGLETTTTLSFSPGGLGGSAASDVRIGASAELSAYYHNSRLSTHSTELSDAFQIEGTIGKLRERFDGSARYYIAPYIYRSQSGALVLDYMVELDEDNMDWWEEHYGKYPDLAFILPWRYATEKGIDVTASRKQKTSDIQFYPPIAHPGDTVVIIARVHNFSLKTFDDTLKVDFYLGDPANGGVKLTDIYGVTGSSKRSTMIYGATDAIHDREEYLTFIWEVPDTVSCSPRIYGVIDPENIHTEIHKNNNVGWNLLNIYDCQECKYAETITQTENISSDKAYYFQAYPNPFSSYCQVRFSLPQPENVQIDLYNLTGQKVAIVTSQFYDEGEHEISLNAENLATGVYILRISAGSYSEVTRLMLVR